MTVAVPPSPPTGLRANGDLVAGEVTLRWDEVSGATSYNVRYTEETCDSDGNCEADDANWQTETNITTSGSGIKEANLGGLTEKTLYRVEAQSVKTVASAWSDFVLVFPTESALGRNTHVATAPFHVYQAKNAQGSHEFRYILCESSIPAGLTMTAADMKDAVDEWEDAVIWDRGGVNIITTSSYSLPAGDSCSSTAIPIRNGRFEVRFTTNEDIKWACAPHKIIIGGDGPPACWRSHSWQNTGVGLIRKGAVLINADRGAAHWNQNLAAGCRKLHEQLVHEVGHAFGIGNGENLIKLNRHPENTTLSIMSYENIGIYCEPQAYDIVAVTALYQSR